MHHVPALPERTTTPINLRESSEATTVTSNCGAGTWPSIRLDGDHGAQGISINFKSRPDYRLPRYIAKGGEDFYDHLSCMLVPSHARH